MAHLHFKSGEDIHVEKFQDDKVMVNFFSGRANIYVILDHDQVEQLIAVLQEAVK